MKIAVVGTGYVGLVAGACFADVGTTVVCVDVDERKLQALEKGEVPFYEPRLADLVKRNWPERLQFTLDLEQAISGASVVFIAVGTPPGEDGSADLQYVLKVAEDVSRLAKHPLVLVLKSTVPVGTNRKVREVVARFATQKISVVSNPEFLKEGDAVNDFLKPDRVVVGTDSDDAFAVMDLLYSPFTRQRDRMHRMTPESAEIVKYAANAMLATKISFMNEISRLCDRAGGDVEQVREALGADTRIGYPFLYAGLGFGGSCFPKDLKALVRTGQDFDLDLQVARAAMETNALQPPHVLSLMKEELGSLAGKRIALWGLAFKPRTDDVREAPALHLIELLLAEGAVICATDPEARVTAEEALERMGLAQRVTIVEDGYAAARDADALVLATEWHQYRLPDFDRLATLMTGRVVFDGRNVLSRESAVAAGFVIRGIGRPRMAP